MLCDYIFSFYFFIIIIIITVVFIGVFCHLGFFVYNVFNFIFLVFIIMPYIFVWIKGIWPSKNVSIKQDVSIHTKVENQFIKATFLCHFNVNVAGYLPCDVKFNFFSKNTLLSPKQSIFRTGNSCINQLYSIHQEILNAFDKGLEVRVIFLDI